MTMVNMLAPHDRPYSFANAVLIFSGGMDAYVREFTKTKAHDDFYTDDTVRGFFLNYLSVVVARYVDCPALLGWEIANDARCASSLAASSSCNTQTVTQFHSDIAQFIRSIDCNHLITSGYVHFRSLAWISI
jgi:mannan endo-1,4-beta-mannosidase